MHRRQRFRVAAPALAATAALFLMAPAAAAKTPAPSPAPVEVGTSPVRARALGHGEGRGLPAGTPFLTRSISPSTNALVVVQVAMAASPAQAPVEVTGAGLRFQLLAELKASATATRSLAFFIAQGPATAGPISMTWAPGSPALSSLAYSVTEFSGVAVGDNGRSAIAQTHGIDTAMNSDAAEGRLDPLRDPARNSVAAFFLAGTRGQDIVPEVGYTKVDGVIGGASMFSLAAAFRAGGSDLTPSATWERVASNLWLTLELVGAPTRPSGTK